MGRPENDSRESQEAKISAAAGAYAAALIAGDEVAAEIAIREAMDAHLSSEVIDDEIIAPALWLVGELWERGEITVADEHIATEISIRVLALQREVQRVAQARGGHRVMLAAPAGELHVVALRMVATLLREAGYGVVMLGADVPADALGAAARRLEPDVICLSSTMPEGADELFGAIAAVQQKWPSARFIVGGRGLTPRIQSQSILSVCARVSEVVEAVDAMVKRAGLN
jgi:MerR family transcriptional regulator, light-induced transcriptional regulator